MRFLYMGLLIIASMLGMLAFLVKAGRYYLHMFQLSSYYNGRFFQWQKKNISFVHIGLAALVFGLSILSGIKKPTPALIFVVFVIATLLYKAPPMKKKLVYTARIKRQILCFAAAFALMCLAVLLAFAGAVHKITPKALFVALYGILSASSFIPFTWTVVSGAINGIAEKKIQKYYINDAEKILNNCRDLKVVGVTGSYGKTSTKFMLNAVLSEKYNTLMTPESYNTIMGVVKTVRTSLTPLHQVFIVEMGAKHVGEIAKIASLVHPDCGVITTVGLQHLESFGSEENITKAKFELIGALKKDGKAFLNYDCEKIRNYNTHENTVTFGTGSDLDYHPENIRCTQYGTEFVLCCKDGRKINIKMKLLGRHNVQNFVSAAAVGIEMGVSEAQIVSAAARLMPVPHRLELKSNGAYTVIDNAFNSNPEGAKESLYVLSLFDGYKKIVVTPGFIELGEKQDDALFEFGKEIAKTCDCAILVGRATGAKIKEGVQSEGFSGELYCVDTLSEALAVIPTIKADKKAVLFENDLPDNYEKQK